MEQGNTHAHHCPGLCERTEKIAIAMPTTSGIVATLLPGEGQSTAT